MNPSALIPQADCFRIPLPDKSVHCCVTSPPYWGLRKYSGNQGDEPLGLEPTPERHIERTVQWAREVYRVLRDDGVFFCNYGDCYAGSGGEQPHPEAGGGGGWGGAKICPAPSYYFRGPPDKCPRRSSRRWFSPT